MQDRWMDRLSEYIDGELAAPEARALERHLEACDACRTAVHDLCEVVARARALEAREPATDLWRGIAAAMAATTPAADPAHADGAAAPVAVPLPRRRASDQDGILRLVARGGPRFTLSLAHLAAAATLLLALGAGAAWMAGLRTGAAPAGPAAATYDAAPASSPILFAAWQDEPDAAPGPAAATPSYDADIAELHRSLDEVRDQLDPATVDVVERSLESIDDAIATARAALAADPGNTYLQRQLEGAMQKKLDVLRRASRVSRGAT